MAVVRDQIGGRSQWDRAAVGQEPGGRPVARSMGDGPARHRRAEPAQDVVEGVILLVEDHHVLDR